MNAEQVYATDRLLREPFDRTQDTKGQHSLRHLDGLQCRYQPWRSFSNRTGSL